MIEALADAEQFFAGMIKTALAAPFTLGGVPRTVGPVAMLAHVLPIEVGPGELPPDFDVRSHPHIGLAAVSYLFAGHCTHRDSLGSRVEFAAGGIGYTLSGRGVVHSERFERLRLLGGQLEQLQIFIALPDGAEEVEPKFVYLGPEEVPETRESGAVIRRLLGPDAGIAFPAPLFFHDVRLAAGGSYAAPDDMVERAVYVLSGEIELDGRRVGQHQVAWLAGGPARVRAPAPAHIVAFGGESVGPR
jgi:redox-sensitive bicupin YhaK (pirin superfamily)